VDFLVFSHGHNDHTGGLKDAMKLLKKNAKIIFHPAALEPKYSRHPDKIHYIGISDENKTLLLNSQYEKLISAKPVKIMDGAWTSGELKQKYPEELAEKKFSLDPDGKIDDNIADDMSLFFETKNGIVIIAGCCHAGLANTIDQSISVFEGKNLHAFIGGTHLGNVTKKRLDFTADFLQKHSIQVFAPSHCTGEMSKNYLYSKNPQIYTPCFAGAEFIF
jgi:7,8-dihydropterin-6-yl-methyl-4-(beta-D-ribofuranosyl)aminobenzene 5'-phosphate synthase